MEAQHVTSQTIDKMEAQRAKSQTIDKIYGGTCTESHVFDRMEAQASVHCTVLMEANDAMLYGDVHRC